LKEMSSTVKPQLPCDTRWNSQLTCIETFIRNRPAYLTIVHEHEDATDSRIAQLVNDFNLYKQAKDMSMQLKPIAVALDRLQSDKSGLADACHEWLSLLTFIMCAQKKRSSITRRKQNGYQLFIKEFRRFNGVDYRTRMEAVNAGNAVRMYFLFIM